MPDYKILPAGDTALVVEFGEGIDRRLSAWVLALARRLERSDEGSTAIIETVPTFRSLMVHYDPLVLPAATLTACIDELMQDLQLDRAGRARVAPAGLLRRSASLPTSTTSRRAPVSRRRRSIERHSAVTYHVYMLGFLPGQAYLGDLPAELASAAARNAAAEDSRQARSRSR